MPKLHAIIYVPPSKLDEMEAVLKSGKMDEQTDKDGVIETFTGKFANGFEADIKVCNAPTDGGGPWVDAVLFDQDGNEIGLCEPSDSLGGEYVFSIGKDEFEVTVLPSRVSA